MGEAGLPTPANVLLQGEVSDGDLVAAGEKVRAANGLLPCRRRSGACVSFHLAGAASRAAGGEPPAPMQVGFPAVLKPTGGAASIGVLRVNTLGELLDGFKRVTAEMSRSVVNGSGVLLQARRLRSAAEGSAQKRWHFPPGGTARARALRCGGRRSRPARRCRRGAATWTGR